MLIVSRGVQQEVIICGFDGCELELKITVLEIRGGKVRLGFETLSDNPASGPEVWERLPLNQRASTSAKGLAGSGTRSPKQPHNGIHSTTGENHG